MLDGILQDFIIEPFLCSSKHKFCPWSCSHIDIQFQILSKKRTSFTEIVLSRKNTLTYCISNLTLCYAIRMTNSLVFTVETSTLMYLVTGTGIFTTRGTVFLRFIPNTGVSGIFLSKIEPLFLRMATGPMPWRCTSLLYSTNSSKY